MIRAPGLFDVDAQTKYWNPKSVVPYLGLQDDLSCDGRVYVLRCQPQIVGGPFTYYVGYVPKKNQIGPRIAKQARQEGADFPKAYKPLAVELVWPAATPAVEALVFYAIMDKLSEKAVSSGRLAGWTQTLRNMSPLVRFVVRREKRMVSGQCLDCGSNCSAGKCTKAAETMPYGCDHCGACVHIANQGKSHTVPPTVCQCPQCKKRPRDADSTEVPPAKASRIASSSAQPSLSVASSSASPSVSAPAALSPSAPARPRGNRCCKLLVDGVRYTSLAWFLGKSATFPQERKAVLDDSRSCKFALEISGGDTKTLVTQGFAKAPPLHAREIMSGDEKVTVGDWFDTTCRVVKRKRGSNAVLQVSRCLVVNECRGKLFRVEDLDRVFRDKD